MTLKPLIISAASFVLLCACSQAQGTAQNVAQDVTKTAANVVKDSSASSPGADIAQALSGVYLSQDAHAYITFQYLHQGFSRPILRWNDFKAVIELDADNPAESTLAVTIDAESIDSGVDKFDDHLLSADFFDADTYPEITFVSQKLTQDSTGSGTLIGDLSMKGITKPVTLDVTLNKVGESFPDKVPMIGISATGTLKRSDWDLGLYTPNVGDEVSLNIQVEFAKQDE